jgi:hypothetical protein
VPVCQEITVLIGMHQDFVSTWPTGTHPTRINSRHGTALPMTTTKSGWKVHRVLLLQQLCRLLQQLLHLLPRPAPPLAHLLGRTWSTLMPTILSAWMSELRNWLTVHPSKCMLLFSVRIIWSTTNLTWKNSFDCNGSGAQNWVIQQNSTKVQLAQSNFCLDAGSSKFLGWAKRCLFNGLILPIN